MSKFHINNHGVPAPCRATKGNCPLGGDETHFSSKEEAQVAADEINAAKYGHLPEVTDGNDTFQSYDDVDKDEEEFVEVQAQEWGEIKEFFKSLIGSEVVATYDKEEKVAEGVVASIYDNPENPGIIISTDDGVKHIKFRRIILMKPKSENSQEIWNT